MKHRLSKNDRRLLQHIEKSDSRDTPFDPVDLLNLLERDDDVAKSNYSNNNITANTASASSSIVAGRQRRRAIVSDSEQYHREKRGWFSESSKSVGGATGWRDTISSNGGRWRPSLSSASLRQLVTAATDNDSTASDNDSTSNSSSFTSRSTRSLFSHYIAWAETAVTSTMMDYYDAALRWCSRQPQPRHNAHHWRRSITMGAVILVLLVSFYKTPKSRDQYHYLGGVNQRSSITMTSNNEENDSFFTMCDRITPFDPEVTPRFRTDWPRENSILVLRSDGGKFGHIGSQMDSVLHAFDYARENRLHLGIFFHSWAMDVISTMFYESESFEALEEELLRDLGVVVIRQHGKLERYDEVLSKNARQLYFHSLANQTVDYWRELMQYHISILQQLFLRYNHGYGYVHSGLRGEDVCTTLFTLFRDRVREVKYSVIHFRSFKDKAAWRLEKIAEKTGITLEGGVLTMGPDYIHSILLPLGMLDHPILLVTDGKSPDVERELFNDPRIGPKLIVLSENVALDGADIALAVLSDVYIGNPASGTSGFIARSRMALGYSAESTQLFRRKRGQTWVSVCNEACVFNPEVMGPWT